MLYASMAFFVLALVAALFGFAIPADPGFSQLAQYLAATFLGASLLVFLLDRAWGAYVLWRAGRRAAARVTTGRLRGATDRARGGIVDSWRPHSR